MEKADDMKTEVIDVTRTVPIAIRDLDATIDMEEIKEALTKAG